MRPDGVYRRYEIGTEPAPNAVRLPPRFRVRVSKRRLIELAVRELIHTRGNLPVALSQRRGGIARTHGDRGRPVLRAREPAEHLQQRPCIATPGIIECLGCVW